MGTDKIERLDSLIPAAQAVGPIPLAIAAPDDRQLLLALRDAVRAGIIIPYLVGDASRIAAVAAAENINLGDLRAQMIDVPSGEGALADIARRAVELVRSGEASVLMKGRLQTSELMRAVLNKEYGLREERLLSHVAMIEVPSLPRLILMSDGGIVLRPSLSQKVEIVRNAITVAHILGLECPKVAILAATEMVSEEQPATVEAAALKVMAERGQIDGAIVDGPLGLDNAISLEAAKRKGIDGPVAGQADILIVPSVEAGNLMGKTLTFLAGGCMAGVVVGGRAPIVITSRADSSRCKLLSIALAVVLESRGVRAKIATGNAACEDMRQIEQVVASRIGE